MKQTRFIRRLVYTLKRGYGFAITLHKITDEAHNYQTGQKVVNIQTQKINKAIILPAHLQRQFESDSQPADFKYGALYDASMRQVIIDAIDLGDFNIEIDDYVIYDAKRWQVSHYYKLELHSAYVLYIKTVEGAVRHLVEEVSLETNLLLTQKVS